MKEGNSVKMVNRDQSHSQRQISAPITLGGVAALATLLGAFIRCFYVFQSDFPLNDGGMFYTMVQDLQKAHYHLPLFTSYNQANIPFAYPPLPFYLTGWLNSIFGIDLLQLERFLPLLFSIATIPAFYWLAKKVLSSDVQVGAATLVFALFSPVYTWQIMGGGLTRSPALFFTVLALAAYFSWVKEHRWIDLIWIILFTSLTTLCHLEMLFMLGLSYLTIFFIKQHSWKVFGQLCLAGLGTLLLTAPWWGTVIAQHGFSPFVQAFGIGKFNLLTTLATLFSLTPTQDLNETIFTLLGVAGAVILLCQRDWLLLVWWLVFVLFDPRSTQRSVTIPVALLAGVSLELGLSWLGKNLPQAKKEKNQPHPGGIDFQKSSIKLILIICFVFAFFNELVGEYTSGSLLSSLNQENRQAMQWVKENTPEGSKFLVIDYPSGWHLDMVGEWFPTISERVSLLTAQGLEWLPDKAQAKTIDALTKVSNCRMEGITCLENWIKQEPVQLQYVYFAQNRQSIDTQLKFTSVVEAQISNSTDYQLVYSNSDVKIYQVLGKK
jgi:hypothetical protein